MTDVGVTLCGASSEPWRLGTGIEGAVKQTQPRWFPFSNNKQWIYWCGMSLMNDCMILKPFEFTCWSPEKVTLPSDEDISLRGTNIRPELLSIKPLSLQWHAMPKSYEYHEDKRHLSVLTTGCDRSFIVGPRGPVTRFLFSSPDSDFAKPIFSQIWQALQQFKRRANKTASYHSFLPALG